MDQKNFNFELNVPSGVMVVGNDFRDHFNFLGDFNTDEIDGRVKTTEAMAEVGCAHAFVGNSCPGMYLVGENEFVIASVMEGKEPGVKVASICTDLWWYSIVDKDEFLRRGFVGMYADAQEVSVRPGVYRFAHNLWRAEEENDVEVFSTIQWVREPDPVRNFAAERATIQFTAGQIFHRSVQDYPTLYGGKNGAQMQADHIFCVVGGGGSWHENGFCLFNPDTPRDEPEMAIPIFDREYEWYPMSWEYSALCGAAEGKINLNPSFVALAYNIVDCILKHGSGKYRDNIKVAERCLEGLEKRYPRTKL